MKAAIYTRVSTDNQAELEFNSCEAQEAKIKAFISSQSDMVVYKAYSDPGYSGATINRPALTEMLQDIKDNKVDLVISYKIDRLTRSPKDFYYLIEIFEKYNVSFISVTERFDTSTPSGRLLRNIMLTFAQFERELTSERTKDKALERAKKGLFGGGACPFGYKRVNKKLVVEPNEAEIVRCIFNQYLKTGSLFRVYDLLISQGILGRNNKPLTKGDIFNILRKPVYIGKVIHLGNVYPGIHDPIISNEQFEQAQELHKHRLVPKWHPAKPFLFPGLLTCKECGSTMTQVFTNKIREKRRKRYYYYSCTSIRKRYRDFCSTKEVSSTKIEQFIIDSLERISLDPMYLEGLHLKHKNTCSGRGQGFELSQSEPDLTPDIIKLSIQNILKTCSSKETINKALAIKKHIKEIVYSKETIEIKIYAASPDYIEKSGELNQSESTEAAAENAAVHFRPLRVVD